MSPIAEMFWKCCLVKVVVLILEPASESPGGLLKQIPGPHSKVSNPVSLSKALEFAFLTNYQVMLLLLVQRPYFEKLQVKITYLVLQQNGRGY